MAYLLHMSDELHDWLADLRGTDPAAAVRVGQALAALMSEGVGLGPPLVVPVMATWPEDLVAALDASYQRRVDRLQVIRRRAADAALLVKDMQGQVDELESAQARLEDQRSRALEEDRRDDAEKAARQLAAAQREATVARQLIPWITETEAWLRTRLQRLQVRTNAFRARREVLKATYTAARAELQVNEELAGPGPADPQAAGVAAARLRDAAAEIERELGRQPLPPGLLELRPGTPGEPSAPGDGEIRLIFAVEPPGTALLIAVLEGREVARDQYREAVLLSADVLLEARRRPGARGIGARLRRHTVLRRGVLSRPGRRDRGRRSRPGRREPRPDAGRAARPARPHPDGGGPADGRLAGASGRDRACRTRHHRRPDPGQLRRRRSADAWRSLPTSAATASRSADRSCRRTRRAVQGIRTF